MDWKKKKVSESDSVVVPDNWIYIHYYEALSTLFRIENALRVFVYMILKKELGSKWSDLALSSDDSSDTTISALAKRRASQASSFGYLGFEINSPIMHLTSGELVRILTSKPYWKYFNKYFKASKEVVTLKLTEIGNIRNSLAHFRPITEGDVDVVKQNANQMLPEVESTLIDAIRCADRVPSNTEAKWFQRLRSIGTEICPLSFSQSSDREWIQVNLAFRLPQISRRPSNPTTYLNFKALKLNSAAAILKFADLYDNCIYVSEGVRTRVESHELKTAKRLSITFAQDTLAENFETIGAAISKLIEEVQHEVDLIGEDHLARGELIETVDISASRHQAQGYYWEVCQARLESPRVVSDPVEYWGDFSAYGKDFISDTCRFPWMAVNISEDDIPF